MNESGPTEEQKQFANREDAIFVEACPGAGKTRTVVARIARIAKNLRPRMGIAVLSFTNSAVEAFFEECGRAGLNTPLKFPSFVGTFDSFLRQFLILPGGIEGVAVCPTVVDSWSSLGIQVRLAGKKAFHGDGVDLDCFDPTDNHIAPETIGHSGLRVHVTKYQIEYIKAAARFRQSLRSKGYLSAADARVETLRKMQKVRWAASLGRALSARFHELIVDEAQDCNPLDLQILAWLRSHGLPVTIVCDPDQAIYGFRYGDPARLREFGAQYASDNQLPLTGNFRSSSRICALAATLRDRSCPDEAVGPSANVSHPVQILEYHGGTVPIVVGHRFHQLLEDFGLKTNASIVLAHKRNSALRAAGLTSTSGSVGTSRIATMAKAVGDFWSSTTSNRARETSLRTMEKMILGLMGKIEANQHPTRAAEQHGIDARWLRRTALELVTRLPKSCPDTDNDREHWLAILRLEVERLALNYAEGVSEKTYFRRVGLTEWSKYLRQTDVPGLRCSTIHEAKGREYEAVCIVISPDIGQFKHTAGLFEAWETRTNYEGKRVIYVGVTRARKLVALAVPNVFRKRLTAILRGAGIEYALHDLSLAPTPSE